MLKDQKNFHFTIGRVLMIINLMVLFFNVAYLAGNYQLLNEKQTIKYYEAYANQCVAQNGTPSCWYKRTPNEISTEFFPLINSSNTIQTHKN